MWLIRCSHASALMTTGATFLDCCFSNHNNRRFAQPRFDTAQVQDEACSAKCCCFETSLSAGRSWIWTVLLLGASSVSTPRVRLVSWRVLLFGTVSGSTEFLNEAFAWCELFRGLGGEKLGTGSSARGRLGLSSGRWIALLARFTSRYILAAAVEQRGPLLS